MVSIDQTLFIEDLIVKKLGPVGRARSYSLGTTVLLNGDIVPILNIPELMAAKDGARRRALGAEELAGSEAPRILVVDDSLFIRNFLEKELGDAGFETTMAIHGLDAVSKLKQQRIDLVLTDLEMPEMDGLDLAKFIKASPLHQHIPVFLVTTRSTPAYRAQAEQAGVDEFIAKPFETDNLEKKIASALARGKKSTSQGATQ
jgi:chemosensory pili system protein ChpA (sensor histidine kinase/response regulator)